MFPIIYPKYRILPRVFLVFDDGLSHTRGNMAVLVNEDIELDPTRENAVSFLLKHVPHEFINTVDYVAFVADQYLDKVQYEQAYLSDAGDLVTSGMHYSYQTVYVKLKNGVASKIEKKSTRDYSMSDDFVKYGYVKTNS
jgi:hypothetical protein